MLDERYCDSLIFKEMSDEDKVRFFDLKQRKFLHNVDTFYYSVKLDQDFRGDSKDPLYKKFISDISRAKRYCDSDGKVNFRCVVPDVNDLYL